MALKNIDGTDTIIEPAAWPHEIARIVVRWHPRRGEKNSRKTKTAVALAGMAAAGGQQYTFKVVLLGEGCVGKTSLVLRYCQNAFNEKHLTTLQVRACPGRAAGRKRGERFR